MAQPWFEFHDYKAMRDAYGKEFDRFIEERTLAFALDLHLKSDFSRHDGLYDY